MTCARPGHPQIPLTRISGTPGHPLGSCALFLSSAWGDPRLVPGHRAEPQLLEAGFATPSPETRAVAGRRRAGVPVAHVSPSAPTPAYVGRRRAAVPVDTVPQAVAAQPHPKVDIAPAP